jgi:putative flippase GtrA
LHGALNIPLAVATACAFCSAFALNFTLSRQWTFPTGRSGSTTGQLTRYGILVVVNLGLTVLIVTGLAAAGLNYLVAKAVATAIVALGNFFAYRHWVFA